MTPLKSQQSILFKFDFSFANHVLQIGKYLRDKKFANLIAYFVLLTIAFVFLDFYIYFTIFILFFCRLFILLWEGRISSASRSRIRINNIGSQNDYFLKMKGTDFERVEINQIDIGDDLLCEAGSVIPADGEIIDGMALVDESAVTGESAPVMRGGQEQNNYCTAGSLVISNRLLIRVTQLPQDAISKKINILTNFSERETPAFEHKVSKVSLILGCGVLCLIVVAYHTHGERKIFGSNFDLLAALCMFAIAVAPIWILPRIQAILSVVFVDKLLRKNLILRNAEVLESAKSVNALLRREDLFPTAALEVVNLFPLAHVKIEELASAAQLASLSDDSAIGRSIVIYAKDKFKLRAEILREKFVQFTKLEKNLSGIQIFDEEGERVRAILKGAPDAIEGHIRRLGALIPRDLKSVVEAVSDIGGVPIVICDGAHILGVIHIQNIQEQKDRHDFSDLGIETVILSDDPVQDYKIDEFGEKREPAIIAANKLHLVRSYQSDHVNVAMIGSRDSDAPALAEADLSIALSSGSQLARQSADVLSLTDSLTRIYQLFTSAHKIDQDRKKLIEMTVAGTAALWIAILPGLVSRANPLHLSSIKSLLPAAAVTIFLHLISQMFFINLKKNENYNSPLPDWVQTGFEFGLIYFIMAISCFKIIDSIFSSGLL